MGCTKILTIIVNGMLLSNLSLHNFYSKDSDDAGHSNEVHVDNMLDLVMRTRLITSSITSRIVFIQHAFSFFWGEGGGGVTKYFFNEKLVRKNKFLLLKLCFIDFFYRLLLILLLSSIDYATIVLGLYLEF